MSLRVVGWLPRVLDLLFPPRCFGCHRRDIWLCPDCIAKLPKPVPPLCRFCGKPTGGVARCPDCWRHRPAVDGVHSPYFFDHPLRPAIHHFKYRRAKHLVVPLASLFNVIVDRLPEVDIIVPVPLYPARQRHRGYNQAALLAAELSPTIGRPVASDCLVRHRDTPPQIGLSAVERHRNVRNAFRCEGDRVAGARVLILDDVCTTGATLDACAQALKRARAASVIGLTLARAR